jgi:hypothetical protein
MRPGIKKNLEKGLNKSSESTNESREPGRNLERKLQNASNEKIAGAENQRSNTPHVDKIAQSGKMGEGKNVGWCLPFDEYIKIPKVD